MSIRFSSSCATSREFSVHCQQSIENRKYSDTVDSVGNDTHAVPIASSRNSLWKKQGPLDLFVTCVRPACLLPSADRNVLTKCIRATATFFCKKLTKAYHTCTRRPIISKSNQAHLHTITLCQKKTTYSEERSQ